MLSKNGATIAPQPMEKRREIRIGLAQLSMDIADPIIKKILGSNDKGLKLGHLLNRADALLKDVEMPMEQALDAEIFSTITTTVTRGLHQQSTEQQRGRAENFIKALVSLHVHSFEAVEDGQSIPEAFCWKELRSAAGNLVKDVPGVSCMHGPLHTIFKERKAAVRQVRSALAPEVRPEEIVGRVSGETESQATDRHMEIMFEIMRKDPIHGKFRRIPVAELVCNHRSYSQTLENMFTLSFLVKAARVILTRNSEYGYMVQALAPVSKEAATLTLPADKETDRKQLILTIHMDDWEVMKELLDEKDQMMPHRPKHGAGEKARSAPSPAADTATAAAAAIAKVAASKPAGVKTVTAKTTADQQPSHMHTPSKKRAVPDSPAAHQQKEHTPVKHPKLHPTSAACQPTAAEAQQQPPVQQAATKTPQSQPMIITSPQLNSAAQAQASQVATASSSTQPMLGSHTHPIPAVQRSQVQSGLANLAKPHPLSITRPAPTPAAQQRPVHIAPTISRTPLTLPQIRFTPSQVSQQSPSQVPETTPRDATPRGTKVLTTQSGPTAAGAAPLSKSPASTHPAAIPSSQGQSKPLSADRAELSRTFGEHDRPGNRMHVDIEDSQLTSNARQDGLTATKPVKLTPNATARVQQQQSSAAVPQAGLMPGSTQLGATQCSSESDSGREGPIVIIDIASDSDEDEIAAPGPSQEEQGGSRQGVQSAAGVVDLTLDSDGDDGEGSEAVKVVVVKPRRKNVMPVQQKLPVNGNIWEPIDERAADQAKKRRLSFVVKKEVAVVPKKEAQSEGKKK